MRRRSACMDFNGEIPLGKGKKECVVYGRGRTGKLVCRVEISAAGMALYAGETGRKLIKDLSWERLVKQFKK
jgi:hypothetical protein